MNVLYMNTREQPQLTQRLTVEGKPWPLSTLHTFATSQPATSLQGQERPRAQLRGYTG